ncbi:MAG: hypothetical protein ACFFCS_02420 [Candidatus Hodarchaeota archaeon]
MTLTPLTSGPFRDIILIFWFGAMLSIAALIFLLFGRIKSTQKARFFSPTTGYMFFEMGFLIFIAQRGLFLFFNYGGIFTENYYETSNIVMLVSFVIMIFFVEFSNLLHRDESKKKKKFYFILTLYAAIVNPVLLYSLKYFADLDLEISFSFAVPPVIIANAIFMMKFKDLRIVKQKKAMIWYFTGMSMAGFSNVIGYLEDIVIGLPNWNFIIHYSMVIIGLSLGTWTFRNLPDPSELDWMSALEKLLIIEDHASILLFQYNFRKTEENIQKQGTYLDDLTGTALGGVSSLLKEILASKGHLKEIDHEEKKIIFNHDLSTVCLLFTKSSTSEMMYRLKIFHATFENEYKNWIEGGGEKVIGITPNLISNSNELVYRFFSK